MATTIRYDKREPFMDAARAEHVDDIRTRIAHGDYLVDDGAVAAAILERLEPAPRPLPEAP